MSKHPMIEYLEHDLGYKKISQALLSSQGIIFESNSPDANMAALHVSPLENLHQLWDEDKFSKINLPSPVMTLTPQQIQSYSQGHDIRVLDCPIKFPGTNYRIPQELACCEEIIKNIAYHEHLINNQLEKYFCYITLDRRMVKAASHTRKAGIHVDGFQGARLPQRLPIDHSYIVYNCLPTIFYNQPFEVKKWWDKSCHNYFEGFELQKTQQSQVTYPVNTVLLMDAYCLHETQQAKQDTFRTFLRLSYTVREFDRLGNAHNPMFDYSWQMYPRDTQMTLSCPL